MHHIKYNIPCTVRITRTAIYQTNHAAIWSFTVSDLLLLFALILLFFEILKSTRTGAGAVLDHLLSTAVFIVALIEFILFAQAATSTFFLIVVITLLDIIAGFSVSITSARRDFSVGNGG